MERKNLNRGYQKLSVWQDAKSLYRMTCQLCSNWPFELKRVAGNQIASVDSVHRNIAEGYGRRGISEYLQFLNYALGSLAESVSGMTVYTDVGHLGSQSFEKWDTLAYKLKNGLIALVRSLQQKRKYGDWDDSFIAKESNVIYETSLTKTEEY